VHDGRLVLAQRADGRKGAVAGFATQCLLFALDESSSSGGCILLALLSGLLDEGVATAGDVIVQGDFATELAVAEHAVVASDMAISAIVLCEVAGAGEGHRVLRAVAVDNSPLMSEALVSVGEDLVACWACMVLIGLVTSEIGGCSRIDIADVAASDIDLVRLILDCKALDVDIAC